MEITFTNILTIVTSLVLVLVGYMILRIDKKSLEAEKEMREYVDLKIGKSEEGMRREIKTSFDNLERIFINKKQ